MSNLENTSNIKPNLAFPSEHYERFINTVASLRRTFEEMSAKIYELDEVIKEVEVTKAEIELLKMAINRKAMEFGLEPMSDRDKKS